MRHAGVRRAVVARRRLCPAAREPRLAAGRVVVRRRYRCRQWLATHRHPGAHVRRASFISERNRTPYDCRRHASIDTRQRLAPRTRALSQHFVDYRGFWLPHEFTGYGAMAEYWACRERVAVMDLSALRKFDVTGP